jgi:hypothetical protein
MEELSAVEELEGKFFPRVELFPGASHVSAFAPNAARMGRMRGIPLLESILISR